MRINIKCKMCGKSVDGMEIHRLAHNRTTLVKVWCHGERDECVLQEDFLNDLHLHREGTLEGAAFTTKNLAVA